MGQIEDILRAARMWDRKTLEELRTEAEHAATGMVFESLRSPTGQRALLIVCTVDMDQIAVFERAFDLVDDVEEKKEDWNTLTLFELVVRTSRGSGFCFESLRDEYKRRIALVLIAAEPRSIKILESGLKPLR